MKESPKERMQVLMGFLLNKYQTMAMYDYRAEYDLRRVTGQIEALSNEARANFMGAVFFLGLELPDSDFTMLHESFIARLQDIMSEALAYWEGYFLGLDAIAKCQDSSKDVQKSAVVVSSAGDLSKGSADCGDEVKPAPAIYSDCTIEKPNFPRWAVFYHARRFIFRRSRVLSVKSLQSLGASLAGQHPGLVPSLRVS